jgi:hypothetical protein
VYCLDFVGLVALNPPKGCRQPVRVGIGLDVVSSPWLSPTATLIHGLMREMQTAVAVQLAPQYERGMSKSPLKQYWERNSDGATTGDPASA